MKYIIIVFILCNFLFADTSAYTLQSLSAANFLADKDIINNNSQDPSAYELSNNITRREMLKVMMKLSKKSVTEQCEGKFTDMSPSDWGCKYAEAALQQKFIAPNETFRPNDNVTQIEALKMIMQAKGTPRDTNTNDWRTGYVSRAQRDDYIDDGFFEYDKKALRSFIFTTGARTYSSFTYESSSQNSGLDPEVEDLLESIFDL